MHRESLILQLSERTSEGVTVVFQGSEDSSKCTRIGAEGVGNFRRAQAGILDRLLHRDMIPRSALAEEAHRAPVDNGSRIERRRALHLGPETELRIFLRARDSGLRLVEARKLFLGVVSVG